MEPIYIVIISIVGLAIFLGIINSANTILMDLFKKYGDRTILSRANTVGLIYFIRDKFDLNIEIKRIHGNLTDCYIPKLKVIALSDDTFNKSTIAAISVTAHELGHAIQHRHNATTFNFVRFSNSLCALFGSLVIPAIVISLLMLVFEINTALAMPILYIAIGVAACNLLARFLIIPIEYSASNIALKFLRENNILTPEELKIAKKLTDAAAFTYVAEFIKDILGLNLLKRRT